MVVAGARAIAGQAMLCDEPVKGTSTIYLFLHVGLLEG
jgi:hypothetical protein